MAESNLLERLDGLVSRFEEVGTLITDPAVIADMKRFVKLNKEYHDLEKIVAARSEYIKMKDGIEEAKEILENEQDPEMKGIAKEELEICTTRIPVLEEEIKLLLVPADPQDDIALLQAGARSGSVGHDLAQHRACPGAENANFAEQLGIWCNLLKKMSHLFWHFLSF